jgi:hypothetical protein
VKLQRTTFETSRAAEYFYDHELEKQTGQPKHNFATVVLKELVDNVLDACETVGVAPKVGVEVVLGEAGALSLTVADNGGGIEPDKVGRILNFNTRLSDKELYWTPTRGQQGNALKSVVAMPFAMGDSDPLVVIRARGVEHRIRAALGAGDVPDVRHQKLQCHQATAGTSVRLRLPFAAARTFKPRSVMRAYHLFNPHVKVSFRASRLGVDHGVDHGESAKTEIAETHLPSDVSYKKFMPNNPLVVHWFGMGDFARLVKHLVSHGKGDMPLGEFLKDFRGFSSRAKASKVRKSVSDVRTLADLTDEGIETLYREMCVVAKEPTHNVLGSAIGEAHLVGALHRFHGEPGYRGRSWYKTLKTHLNGALAIVEVAVVETQRAGGVYIGINHSPTYADPLAETYLFHKSSAGEVSGFGIKGFLRDARVIGHLNSAAVAVHITAAAPTTLDRGKTRLSVDDSSGMVEALEKALWSTSKVLYKEAKRRERDAAAAERDTKRRIRQSEREERRITQAEACYQVMEEAYAYSTGNEALPTTVRDLYYAVRNRIKRFGYDADELRYKYFSQTILPNYRREVRDLPKVIYEPRGTLYEPHEDGREVPLGTRTVAEYNFPDYVFDKILYIEKNGRVEILRAAGVDKRHDMALVGGQGYSTEAIRTLFAAAEEGDYQLFVLHDADPDGYGIARTLREETKRMPDHSVDVIDIGLNLEDALALGKEPETFTRNIRLDAAIEPGLTEVEREHFVGEERKDDKGKPYWIAKRVELNDLSSPQLVEYVERKLEESGVRGKVIPPADALEERCEAMYREKVDGWVDEIIAELLQSDELKEKLAEEHQERFGLEGAKRWIEVCFERDRSKSWSGVVDEKLEQRYKAEHENDLRDAVSRLVRERSVEDEEAL